MGVFDHSSRSSFVRSDTDVGWEGLAHSLRSNSSQKCFIGLTLQKVADLCALCASASADPLCHFTWPTISWLSCCRSQTLPLCYNITDSCGIFSSEEISRLDLLHRWHPITAPRWSSPSSWERAILSQMFVEAVCMQRCLDLYTCGHGSGWNTWI